MMRLSWILLFSSYWLAIRANVEKVIFSAPETIALPATHPNLDDLYTIVLSPSMTSVRMQVNASFPSASLPKGTQTWLLLDDLNPSRRYEVRVCWLATVRLNAIVESTALG